MTNSNRIGHSAHSATAPARQGRRTSTAFWLCFTAFFAIVALVGLVAHAQGIAGWAPAILVGMCDALLAYGTVHAIFHSTGLRAREPSRSTTFVGRTPGRILGVLLTAGALSLVALSVHGYSIGNAYAAAPDCTTARPQADCKSTMTATITTAAYHKPDCAASVTDRYGYSCSSPSMTLTMETASRAELTATIPNSQPAAFPARSTVTIVVFDNRVYAVNGVRLITDAFDVSGFVTSLELCVTLLMFAVGVSFRPRGNRVTASHSGE